jgi:hypothetical protein
MPEITVNIIWSNKKRGSQFESLVEILSNGVLSIGGVIVSSDSQLTDDQIVDKAIDQVYVPMIQYEEYE